jgi:hypothetical protein
MQEGGGRSHRLPMIPLPVNVCYTLSQYAKAVPIGEE